MLEPEVIEIIPEWVERYKAEWARIKGTQDGLQLVRSGEEGTMFSIGVSRPDFYEQIVIARLPELMRTMTTPGTTRRLRDKEKPWEKRRVELTSDQVDTVLMTWSKNKSALTLPFVAAVWQRDGQIKYRT